MFTKAIKLETVADVEKLVELKGDNPLVYKTLKKKDGSEVAATNGLVVAVAEVGGYRVRVHNDVSKVGLTALKKIIEAGEIPEKYIKPTRTGKGTVIKLTTKDGKEHNTHIYLKPVGRQNKSVSNVSEDDIEW